MIDSPRPTASAAVRAEVRRATRVLVVILAAALLLVAEPAGADPPPVFESFSPAGLAPGDWRLTVPDASPPALDGCAGRARLWQRSDRVKLGLIWQSCDPGAAATYVKAISVTRIQYGSTWADRSVLGGADVVQPVSTGVVRSWVQSNYVIMLVTTCDGLDPGACAALTGPAAVYLSGHLPGTPVYSIGLPPVSALVGAFAVVWGLMVGGAMLRGYAGRVEHAVGPADPRIEAVDAAAVRLRRLHGGRRWGQFLVVVGVIVMSVEVLAVVRTAAVMFGVQAVLCGAVPVMAGAVLLARCRHPMLGNARRIEGSGVARLTVRRMAALTLTVLLGVFAVVFPILSVVAMFLLNLAQSDQDTAQLFAYAIILALAGGWLIDRAARRFRARNASEKMAADRRPAYLYLRYFGDDGLRIPATALTRRGPYQVAFGWASILRSERFEEIFTRAVSRYGPVIAVDPPDGQLRRLPSVLRVSQLGAAKTSLPADGWQETVEQMAGAAEAVIVAATPGQIRDGLRWEMRLIAERVRHGHLILIVGPHKSKADTIRRFNSFIGEFCGFPMFAPLADAPVAEGTLILVHVPNEGWGTWYGWAARYRTAWTYTAAIGAALTFATAAWRRPTMTPDPFRGMPITEPVRLAMTVAAGRRGPQEPVGSGDLLAALSDVDHAGRWDRVWLDAASHGSTTADDPDDPATAIRYGTMLISRTCERALATSARIARRYGLVPIPAGVVALGLIDDPRSGAARRLGVDGPERHDAARTVIQRAVLGTTLEPRMPPPAVPPSPPVVHPPVDLAQGSRPLSRRYRIWSVIGLGALGWGLVNAGRDGGLPEVVSVTSVALILTPVLMYALARSGGSGRYARRAAIGGAVVVLLLGVIAGIVSVLASRHVTI